MADFVRVPESDWQDILDATRAKTGGTEKLVSGEVAGLIEGISGGGGNYTNEQVAGLISRNITEFVIPEGTEKIGEYAFYTCRLQNVTIPDSVTRIESNAFHGCPNLKLTELPDTVEFLGTYAFASNAGARLKRLPENLKYIDSNCFIYSSLLKIKEIPAKVKTINGAAFQQCTALTEITFKGTPTTIKSNVFVNCTNLLTINVPWAEGAVANAPWGATNATINYNYVEG